MIEVIFAVNAGVANYLKVRGGSRYLGAEEEALVEFAAHRFKLLADARRVWGRGMDPLAASECGAVH